MPAIGSTNGLIGDMSIAGSSIAGLSFSRLGLDSLEFIKVTDFKAMFHKLL
jgi:hypothetical protein